MKKFLLLVSLMIMFSGCTQKQLIKDPEAYCSSLNDEACFENQDKCTVCGESQISSYASCHSIEFCKNIPMESKKEPQLTSNKWTWVSAKDTDGTMITPAKPGIFTLTFTEDGQLNIGTDCNNMGAGYTAKDGTLKLTEVMSTLMYCEGSEESKFSALLGKVDEYKFSDNGELILSSQNIPDLMTFKADKSFWKSVPQGDFVADTRDSAEVCEGIQAAEKLDKCTIILSKSSMDKLECADGMSVAGCFACKFECE